MFIIEKVETIILYFLDRENLKEVDCTSSFFFATLIWVETCHELIEVLLKLLCPSNQMWHKCIDIHIPLKKQGANL